ncbi:methyltransferase domain-containing protein [Mycobacterium sp. PS03-16]|uniref:mycofactocin oligosaccharide methyltransferase MftM n=1 Tax=Mycobacterium sp. PS03-16 TaxID=2559611 RepID=UPI001073F332|nr:mycofactocin oligosaccharide methyltransferase MftM [Mycobacterium sp. PS03-16]TFV57619.1 methyltransferase domain-containing protein [Mycobacterium sp. PS03-16]
MLDQLTVRVRRRSGAHPLHHGRDTLCTSHFCAHRSDGILEVAHDLDADDLSDDLAELLADELDDAGVLRGLPEFEAVFAGVVESTDPDREEAWSRFYANSLDRLERGCAAFAPVHEHAASLLVGHRLIDLGSCFGFFPLRAAGDGYAVLATDLSAPTMDLLARAATWLGRPVKTLACDAAQVPLAGRAADTVTVLHLIEHLEPDVAEQVLDEALRLARRRVIAAVPFEDEPRACYGHIQRFDEAALRSLGSRIAERHHDVRVAVHSHHGGWLVFDR